MTYFAACVFISAFLLFQVQPMIGRFILPWFGGTPTVWSTAMLFFELLLTGGYAYAHWLVRRPRQGRIHLALLALTCALLVLLGTLWPSPVTPSAALRPADESLPILRIFLILAAATGLPYFVLSANSTLMQAWFHRSAPGRSYGSLYAISNAGSLLGLLAYPLWIEPSFSLRVQGWLWTGGFALFAISAGVISRQFWNAAPEEAQTASAPLERGLPALWILLSGTAGLFLLSATNQISQEVAVIPFLWILPLALYLLSFILTFTDARLYDRRLYALLFSLASLAMTWVLTHAGTLNVLLQIAVHALLFFLAAMICHGELYRLRPASGHLTRYYLMISIGGAAGGLFVNLAAPLLFRGYWEFYLAWLMTVAVLVVTLLPRLAGRMQSQARCMLLFFAAAVVLLAVGLNGSQKALFAERNFYGVIRVKRLDDGSLAMIHGVTVHGLQDPKNPRVATTYYAPGSGAALVLQGHPRAGKGLRVGVLGLGAGTLAAYGQPGDEYTFYEINPAVIRLAEGEGGYFTFLKDSAAQVRIVPGDARISLESQLAAGQAQGFDVLVLDTFSSDSIPVHLVTREAFALYLSHLSADGILAAHISNRHLDLRPVFWDLAHEFGLTMVLVQRPADGQGFLSDWVLLSRDPALLAIPAIQSRTIPLQGFRTDLRLWTDDYSNLFQILR